MVTIIVCCILSACIGYFVGSILSLFDHHKNFKSGTLEESIEEETLIALDQREWEKRNGQ